MEMKNLHKNGKLNREDKLERRMHYYEEEIVIKTGCVSDNGIHAFDRVW